MAEFNASTYPTQQPQPNPLTSFGQVAGLVGALNQNRLFQQTFAARQAIGHAYSQSIDPQTGELDTNKLLANVAQNPSAAFMAGDVAQQALARQQTQLGIYTQQLQNAISINQQMNQRLGSLSADPSLTPQKVTKAVADAVSDGIIPAQVAALELSSMPSDGNGLRDWLLQHQLRNADIGTQLNAIYGQIQATQTGAGTQYAAVSPVTGARALGFVPNQLGPQDLAKPYSWTDASGTQHQGTVGQFLQQTGQLPQPGAPSQTPAVSSPLGTGRFPTQADSGGPGPPPGGPVTGPAPGVVEAQKEMLSGYGEQAKNLMLTADQVPQRKAALGLMLTDMQNFTPGPGASLVTVAKSWANRNLLGPFRIQFDPQSVAGKEGFDKLANQIALAQTQSLGTGTDEKLETAMGANPHSDLSKLGVTQIVHMLQGNEDYIAAKNRAWQQHLAQGGTAADYGKWSAQWNNVSDPRVFQSQYMTPQERAQLGKSLAGPDLQHFKVALNTALQNGWVNFGQ